MEPEIYTPEFLESKGYELAAVLFGGFMVLRYGVQIGGPVDYSQGCGTMEFDTLNEAFTFAVEHSEQNRG